ncbi:Calx-beta domain-containing protein [Actinoplanes subglobosus]|uniref:Calx-beta domain-containing protein n=1 Tax=Actinoplanes subglobosus TaxID=1547892 RepID=A0ABV8IQ46_9ACTN
MRTLLSAAVAGAIGLAPAVFVASPAYAMVPTFTVTTTATASAPIVETATTTVSGGVTTVTQKKATVFVTLSEAAPDGGVEIPLEIGGSATNDTAVGGADSVTTRDFTTPITSTVTIDAGEFSSSIDVEIYDDKMDEDDTQFFTVRVPSDYTDIAPLSAATRATKVYIADDEATPTVSVGDAGTVTEADDASLLFPITLSGRSEKTVTVEATTANGVTAGDSYGATAGSDYTALNKTVVTVQKNSVSGVAVVPVLNDEVVEASPEKLTLSIANPTNATLGTPTSGSGSITDDEAAPTVKLSLDPLPSYETDAVTTFRPEGNTGEAAKTINVKLSGTSSIPVRLNYEFVPGNGTYPATKDKDYKGASGTLTIAPNQTSATIPVTFIGDTIFEPGSDSDRTTNDDPATDGETFAIVLTSPNGSVSADNLGAANATTFTIGDDDSGPATFATSNVEVKEGDSGTTVVKVPVTLSAPLDIDAVLPVSVTPISAVDDGVNEGDTAGANDYDPPTAASVTIKAGETAGYAEVVINGDTVFEKNETLTVGFDIGSMDTARLSATPAPGTLHTALVTVTNDDAAPTFTFSDVAAPEGGLVRIGGTVNGIAQDPYTIAFAAAASASATANAAGAVETVPATPGVDYETTAIADFTVPRGKSGTVVVSDRSTANLASIYLLPDDIDEPTETFTVTATEKGTTLVGFAKSVGTYRITDDPSDLPPAASLQDESIGEWEQSVDVGVDLIPNGEATSTTQTIKIPYKTVDGTAKAGEDYVKAEGVLEIKPGDTPKINVKIINDKWAEDEETFEVRFGSPVSPVGASVVKSTGEVTIKSDDKTDPVKPTLSVTGPAKGVGGATISGKAAPNATVELWGAMLPETDPAKGKWLAEVKSDDEGWFKFPSRSLSQGWVFAVQATDMVSSAVTVKVTQNPSFSASTTKGKLNVSVAGNPKASGQAVTVQRLSGGKWVNVGKGTTNSAGAFKKAYSFKSKTKLTLRVQVGGTSSLGINSGWSAQKKITIK